MKAPSLCDWQCKLWEIAWWYVSQNLHCSILNYILLRQEKYSELRLKWLTPLQSSVHKIKKCQNYFLSIWLQHFKILICQMTMWMGNIFQISSILVAQQLRNHWVKKGRDPVRVCFYASFLTSDRTGKLWFRAFKSSYLSSWATEKVEISKITLIHHVFWQIWTLRTCNQMERK